MRPARQFMLAIVALGLVACSLDEAEMREQARSGGPVVKVSKSVRKYLEPDADIAACETYIRAGIESPSSYRRLSVTRRDRPISVSAYADMLGELGAISSIRDAIALTAEDGALELRDVTIISVGDDLAGPRIRRTDTCRFAVFGDRIPEWTGLESDVEDAIGRRQFYRMAEAGMIAGIDAQNLRSEYSAGCCLPRDAYTTPAEAAR